jgi:hypothetical protein
MINLSLLPPLQSNQQKKGVVALDVNEAQGELAYLRSKDAPLEAVLQTPQGLAP